ncbi:MAG: YbaY family lipoprotein [Verrucomicrobiales bacterium]|nr:YbaY family lipoprotein [Verrucomicrobiales bacterium]
MKPALLSALLLVTASAAAGCHHKPKPRPAVTGNLSYDQFVVTPGCSIEVRLDDVTVTNSPEFSLSRQFIDPRESSPIPFTLHYEPKSIDAAHKYAVSARISCGSELRMISEGSVPVLTFGNPTRIDLTLKPALR